MTEINLSCPHCTTAIPLTPEQVALWETEARRQIDALDFFAKLALLLKFRSVPVIQELKRTL